VLKFTSPIGPHLIIGGVLNGTRVFLKGYNVGGVEEFTLPDQLNGSVVVRCVYNQ
jgi:hypothetical protein